MAEAAALLAEALRAEGPQATEVLVLGVFPPAVEEREGPRPPPLDLGAEPAF
jgi:hypothetical protein